jgi:hypothetical protein
VWLSRRVAVKAAFGIGILVVRSAVEQKGVGLRLPATHPDGVRVLPCPFPPTLVLLSSNGFLDPATTSPVLSFSGLTHSLQQMLELELLSNHSIQMQILDSLQFRVQFKCN